MNPPVESQRKDSEPAGQAGGDVEQPALADAGLALENDEPPIAIARALCRNPDHLEFPPALNQTPENV